MQAYVPDDLAKGTVHFFLGQCLQQLNRYSQANEQFEKCAITHYAHGDRNCFLVHFALAKTLQCLGKHKQALEKFDFCLLLLPDNAHCLFRRAWSQKVTST